MKTKLICALLAGFLSHKAIEEIYDYYWHRGFQQYLEDIQNEEIEAPLTKRFACTYEKMGLSAYLAVILVRPHWSDISGERWYY